MPAETHTPTVLGGTKPSPDEPAPNRAKKDPAMPPNPRSSRETGPGPRPATAPLRPSGERACPGRDPGEGPGRDSGGESLPRTRSGGEVGALHPRNLPSRDPLLRPRRHRPRRAPCSFAPRGRTGLSGPSGPATPASVGAQAEYDPLPPPAGGRGKGEGGRGPVTSLPPPLTSSPPPLLSFPRKREPRACAPRLLRRH